MSTNQAMRSTHNFNAGPAVLPLPALERAQAELLDFSNSGMSVMELSHRSKPYMALQEEAAALVRELLAVPEHHRILFLQGGASLQFSMVPMNLSGTGGRADYVLTDSWSQKALEEAEKIGPTRVVASSEDTRFDRIPGAIPVNPDAAYLHITSNNTIAGTQFQRFPETGAVPLVADMSSDLMSRPIDVGAFGLLYAGAQKNLGPSGLTLVIVREDLLARAPGSLPTMLDYRTHAKNDSLYNTPPTFAIYMLRNVLDWVKAQGGVRAMQAHNERKAGLVYAAIDRHPQVFQGHAARDSRSMMNLTFRLASPEMEQAFLQGAKARRMEGLAGHRSVGGCRASMYNALPMESAEALAAYMEEFASKQG